MYVSEIALVSASDVIPEARPREAGRETTSLNTKI